MGRIGRTKVPKFKSLSEKDQTKVIKLSDYFGHEFKPRRVLEEKPLRAALDARELSIRTLEKDPAISMADQKDFQTAVNLYNMKKLSKGLRLVRHKGGISMPGYELNWISPNPLKTVYNLFRQHLLAPYKTGAGAPGPVLGIFIYPVVIGMRILILPLHVSSRIAARLMKQHEFKKEFRRFGKTAKDYQKKNKKPLPVLMYVAYMEELDRMPKKEYEAYLAKMGTLSKKEKEELEELRRNGKKKAA